MEKGAAFAAGNICNGGTRIGQPQDKGNAGFAQGIHQAGIEPANANHDMIGIAEGLTPMSATTAERLERALRGTAAFDGPADISAQAELLATRDRLLELA